VAIGPITKINVDALNCPPSKDREILWDSGHREAVRGFGVAAFRNGGSATSPNIARMGARGERVLASTAG
jgi:hypothetical protein